MTEFETTGPTITAADVDDFEAAIGTPLPADYKQFLLTVNGGIPTDSDVNEPTQRVVGIVGFFSLAVPSGDLSMQEALRTWRNRYPGWMLPVALCQGSCLLLLTLNSDYEGEVVYWDHDAESEDDEPPTIDNLSHVADSFTELLDSLYTWDAMNDPEVQRMMGGSGGDAWIHPDFSPGPRRD